MNHVIFKQKTNDFIKMSTFKFQNTLNFLCQCLTIDFMYLIPSI